MWSGLFLILMGIFIWMEPKILVVFLSGILIASGLILMILHWRLRKVYRAWEKARSPFDRFIIRF